MDKKVVETPKKKYAPPALTRYGSVYELTKKIGFSGSSDHATGFTLKRFTHA
jgi:hypothetical protein